MLVAIAFLSCIAVLQRDKRARLVDMRFEHSLCCWRRMSREHQQLARREQQRLSTFGFSVTDARLLFGHEFRVVVLLQNRLDWFVKSTAETVDCVASCCHPDQMVHEVKIDQVGVQKTEIEQLIPFARLNDRLIQCVCDK